MAVWWWNGNLYWEGSIIVYLNNKVGFNIKQPTQNKISFSWHRQNANKIHAIQFSLESSKVVDGTGQAMNAAAKVQILFKRESNGALSSNDCSNN